MTNPLYSGPAILHLEHWAQFGASPYRKDMNRLEQDQQESSEVFGVWSTRCPGRGGAGFVQPSGEVAQGRSICCLLLYKGYV